jgi:hypothetical protein
MTVSFNVVGCSRNDSANAAAVSRNIRAWATAFDLRHFLLVEGPSTDGTRECWTRELGAIRPVFLNPPPGLDALPRTVRIAVLRNLYLDALRQNENPASFTVVMDFDDVNACEIAPEALARSFAFLEEQHDRAACFAVQEGMLYDVYALRHPAYCPDDCWERVRTRPTWMSHAQAVWTYVGKRQSSFPVGSLTEVGSAFGGLGVYKTGVLTGASYSGSRNGIEVCEHVEIHSQMTARNNRLFVCPWLVNVTPDEHRFRRPSFVSRMRDITKRMRFINLMKGSPLL